MVLNKGDMGEGGSRSSELHVGRELHVSHNCAGMGSVIGERGPGSNVGYWGGGGVQRPCQVWPQGSSGR